MALVQLSGEKDTAHEHPGVIGMRSKITGILMVRAAQGPALLSRGWQERAVEMVPLQAAHGVRSFMGRLTPEQLHPAGG